MSGRRTIIPGQSVSSDASSSLTAIHQATPVARRSRRQRVHIKSTTLAAYTGVFLLVVALVAIGYQPPQKSSTLVANAASPSDTSVQSSVDQVVATTVAANIAASANLPVAANIANMSQSLNAESQLDQTTVNTISKPQVVQPSADSRSIQTYTAKAGDTVESVAAQFNVSPNTIRWANNLESDALTPGQQLKILPTNGVLYTVQAGDTVASLASKYQANPEMIVAYNDLEMTTTLPAGKQLIIPSGVLPANEQPGYVNPIDENGTNYGGDTSYIDASLAGASAGNRYAFGNCTWYAYNRRAELGMPIGSFWGNAATWAAYARAAGYAVNGTPSVGAIMQSGGGYGGFGHVAIVE
ncbi:MAG TPA: LysM peptidoglycan-binding domain-containing protein [Candidatus Saccharimonadaceae bacterium]|nr:LysM peptidoglycan-binding domain-containing protein [Candidatus Saccharimonadaceae bacterium]